jgi:hypothetical protein
LRAVPEDITGGAAGLRWIPREAEGGRLDILAYENEQTGDDECCGFEKLHGAGIGKTDTASSIALFHVLLLSYTSSFGSTVSVFDYGFEA